MLQVIENKHEIALANCLYASKSVNNIAQARATLAYACG